MTGKRKKWLRTGRQRLIYLRPGINLSQDRIIYDMISSMELERPTHTPILPELDLGIVLEALSIPPYEPQLESSLKHLTYKMVFLLAMAERCNEL